MAAPTDYSLKLAGVSRVPLISSVIAISLAVLALAGWAFGIDALIRVLPSWPPMAGATAFLLILVALALLLVRKSEGSLTLSIVRSLALIVVAGGLFSLVVYFVDGSFTLNNLMVQSEPGEDPGTAARRISPAAALSFVMSAIGILLLTLETRRGLLWSQHLAFAVFVVALAEALAHAYSAPLPYSAIDRPGMALNTAIAFGALATGIFCARMSRRLLIVASDTAGGLTARRLLPAALLVPAAFGFLTVLGERAGYYDPHFGLLLLVVSNVFVLLIVIWRNSELLHRIDLERREASKMLQRSYDELEKRVEQRSAELAQANDELRREVTDRERMEKELRRREQELADFFENAPVGLTCLGPGGVILRANRANLELLGYAHGEYVGHNISEFHANADEMIDILRRLERGEAVTDYEARLRAKDGTLRDIQIDCNGLWDDDHFVHARCFTSDITERKQVEEATAALLVREKAAREQAEEATELIRRLQFIIDASLTHLSLDELLNQLLTRIVEFLSADGAAILVAGEDDETLTLCSSLGLDDTVAAELGAPEGIARRIKETRTTVIVNDLEPMDGMSAAFQEKVRSLIGAPLMIEREVIGVIQVAGNEPHTFTDNDLRLLQLVADRVALAIQQSRLYEAEQRARMQAEAGNRLKDEFLATVSHELRSPLNAVLGWVKLLREGRLSEGDATRALEIVERSARNQNRIINDILDVSRIISGKLRLNVRAIDPGRIIEAAVESVRSAADAKAIRLFTSLDRSAGSISGDADRLQQLVWNLLSNAVKFTPDGGRVDVILQRADSQVEIIVSDTGAGISDGFLPHVFERFRQADGSSTRKEGGLGLGLAIVRHLVELHGGTVHVESQGAGQGSTFTVRLPRPGASSSAKTQSDAGKSDYRNSVDALPQLDGLRVLVVDDDTDARDQVAAVLSGKQAEIRTAASSSEAMQILCDGKEWQPEVLIS
ncbi:MAG TPA: ATP-binding protein, partial [Blastocatellia bacterium]|nr:ATP-binding protein [Blastocatellia bacterium]